MRIKKGFRLAALLLILVSVFAVLCAADGTYEELYPTSDTGAYNYTYTEASPARRTLSTCSPEPMPTAKRPLFHIIANR